MSVAEEDKRLFACTVSPDRMSVRLAIDATVNSGKELTKNNIMKELARLGVNYGLLHDIIDAAVECYNNFGEGEEGAVIARGKEPAPGSDGRTECLLRNPEYKVLIDQHGAINFKEIDTIPRINKGQPILRLIPSTKGRDGADVFGKSVPARDGKPAALPRIPNAAPDPHDPNVLISMTNGCAVLKNGTIEISMCHEIKGDVDFSSGNIHFEGAVKIYGDVKACFEINTKGNVEIDGTVEDAIVRAGGDVTVKGGFVGKGKGLIEAAGNVRVGFIRNQTIKSEGNIYVMKESVDSRLCSNSRIYVAGKRLGLAGGAAFAREGMELSALGTDGEIKTEIALGSDPEIKKNIDAINGQMEQLKSKKAYCANKLKEIQDARKKSVALFQKMISTMEAIMDQEATIDLAMQELIKSKGQLEKKNKICLAPKIKVYGEIYPGVTLLCNGFKRTL
jgi:hypothetical protein